MSSTSETLPPAGGLTLLCIATLTIMVGAAIAPSLNAIAEVHGLDGTEGWLITLPALGAVVFGLAAGSLINAFGARVSLAIGLLLYGLLGIAGAFIPSTIMLYIDRFLLGGATVLVMTSGTALISEFYSGGARMTMIARQGMAIEIGGVVFLALGGVLAALGWRWPFALYLVAWVFLAALLWFVPRKPPTRHAQQAPKGATTNPRLLDIYLAACGSMVVFFVAFITMPGVLADAGMGESEIGFYLAFVSLVAVGAASFMPRMAHAMGARQTLAIAFAFYAGAHAVYALSPGFAGLVLAGLLLGTGFGLSVPLVNHEVVERANVSQRAKALAILSMTIFTGQFLSSLVEMSAPQPAQVFLVALLLSAAFAILCLVMRKPAHP